MLTIIIQIVFRPRAHIAAPTMPVDDVTVAHLPYGVRVTRSLAWLAALRCAGQEGFGESAVEQRFECFAEGGQGGGECADENFGDGEDGEVDGCVGWVRRGVEGLHLVEFEGGYYCCSGCVGSVVGE